MSKAAAKKAVPVGQSADRADVIERVGMKRWLRLTARKHSVGKPTANPAAGAAAEALAKLLAEPKKLA